MNFEHETERAWIEGYTNGTLTAAELAALEAHLQSSRAGRARLLRYLRLDAALHRRVAVKGVELARVWTPRTEAPAPRRFPSRMAWPLAWAAAVALLAGLAFFFFKPEAPRALLATTSGDVRVWRAQQTIPGKAGFVLQAGDWLLTGQDGAAEVEFPGETTRLAIGAEAEFGVVTAMPDKQLKLTTGTLRASVARQSASHPMLIRTPTAKAEVLGTKFELNATKVRTQMTVEEGRVLIARTDDESGVVIEARQSATVTATEPVAVKTLPVAQFLDAGLLARWTFDEGAGLVAGDASGHGRALAFSADGAWGEGRAGRALDLHAVQADVASPHVALPAVFTVAVWLKIQPGGPARPQPVLHCGSETDGGNRLWLTLPPTFPGSAVALEVSGQAMGARAQSRAGVIRVARWHHVAVIVDGAEGRATIFVDGADVTESGGLRRGFQLAGPLRVGRLVRAGPLPFDGQLDELRIYSRALSPAEITALSSP